MQKYGSNGMGSLIVKGVLLLVGIVILIAVAKTIISIVVTILVLAALAFGLVALLRYLGKRNRNY